MTPDTVHLIAQVIRTHRGFLTNLEGWVQKQPKSETRDELFRIINWYRRQLKAEEHDLASL